MDPILLYARSIAVIDAARLRNILFIPGEGVLLRHNLPFKELPLVGLAECRCDSKVADKSRLYESSFSAALSEPFKPGTEPLAFLITTVSGDRFLVGQAEPPYPLTATSTSMPGRVADAAGYTLSVELKDTRGISRVLD